MAHRGESAVLQAARPQSDAPIHKGESNDHKPLFAGRQMARPAFATRAQAQLLETLGWQFAVSQRHKTEHHDPLQCCFILRAGRREEAVFGYTALTAPHDAECSYLRMAKARVECHLGWLGEDRGMLIQNTPLFAFGGRNWDRIVLFGGWRLCRGTWRPFLLGPGGPAGQEMLFAHGTAPHHMAEVCGHDTQAVAERIAALVHAIDRFGRCKPRIHEPATPGPEFDGMEIEPYTAGWFKARPRRTPGEAPTQSKICKMPMSKHTSVPVLSQPKEPVFRHAKSAAPKDAAFWAYEADEFRFHEFGMDRG